MLGTHSYRVLTPARPMLQGRGRRWANPNIQRRISMKFRPLHDRVVVRRVEQDERTPGGIIIPDTAKEKPQEGEIIAVGPGARGEDGKLHPLDVKQGARVLLGKWSGTAVKVAGAEIGRASCRERVGQYV